MTGTAELIQLRNLLFEDNYDALLQLREAYEDPEVFSSHISAVISEAIEKRLDTDPSFPKKLRPVIEHVLIESITTNPVKIADILYPVIGPAIRKSIYHTLTDTINQLNQVLEHSFSIRALRWRFIAWRTGQSYAHIMMMNTLKFQVEQVFLINKENGLLLQHVQADHALVKDPDMVSGMLTAIQDFIKDSFAVNHEDNLRQMRLGELTVQMEHGPQAVIACVIRGYAPNYFSDLLSDTLEAIHQAFAKELESRHDNPEEFSRAESWLRKCLIKQEQTTSTKKSPSILLYLIFTSLVSLATYALYQNYQSQQQWHEVFKALEQSAGLVILNTTKTADGYNIKGLLDPLADQPQKIIQNYPISHHATQFNLTPYLSMDEEILLRRAQQTLVPPSGVAFTLADNALNVIGTAQEVWVAQLHKNWRSVAGLKGINIEQLTMIPKAIPVIVDTRLERLKKLMEDIEHTKFLFDASATVLTDQAQNIQTLAQSIIELLQLTNSMQKSLQIQVIGNTDLTGSQEVNQRLRIQREAYVRFALIQSGVPGFILASQSYVNQPQTQSQQLIENERSIRFKIRVY